MGQYHYVVNLDKRQFLHPHQFGDGLKLMEFGCSAPGTMTALAVLLASSNGRGGGDFREEECEPGLTELVGSWAGDRIVISGDYDDGEKWFAAAGLNFGDYDDRQNIYNLCDSGVFQDISLMMANLLRQGGEDISPPLGSPEWYEYIKSR